MQLNDHLKDQIGDLIIQIPEFNKLNDGLIQSNDHIFQLNDGLIQLNDDPTH